MGEIAARYGIAVNGPNSEGFANIAASLCPTFSPVVEADGTPLRIPNAHALPGEIAVIAQSGGMGFAFYDHARSRNINVRYVMTTGNEACLEALDYVEAMLDEGRTDAFLLLLEDVKDRFMGRFTVHHVLSREKQEIGLLDGRIDGAKLDALLKTLPAGGIDHAFLCGPGGLIADGKAALARAGVAAERVHVEYFSADGSPVATAAAFTAADAQEANVDIVLNGTHHAIAVRGGETLEQTSRRPGAITGECGLTPSNEIQIFIT